MIADWHVGETWAVEPNVHQLPASLAEKVTLHSLNDALKSADLLVMLVDHASFKAIPGEQVQQSWIVDAKGVWR